jgi:site-specific recombinase XerD
VRIGLSDEEIKILEQDIRDYGHWIESTSYKENIITKPYPIPMGVSEFLSFLRNKERTKKRHFELAHPKQIDSKGKCDRPSKNRKRPIRLPGLYEHYLLYHKESLQISDQHARNVRRVLTIFHDYLKKHHIVLSALKIEHLDAFMGEFKAVLNTRRVYRCCLRGFLKYLYREKEIIKRDLAPLLVGPPMFAEPTPPKFLRPEEVKKLFSSLNLKTPADIRTYAIVHLTYTLGLRPIEITRITLDDISFKKGELTLPDRKADNPITLPVPENTLKAIAAYIIKARPKSPNRHIFLSCYFPYKPMNSGTVVGYLSRIMKRAGLPSSGYWLRHTYAQNLLETGRSIYEIKEMLGHQSIQSSHRYIYIHTELMRKVLFNETL